VGNKEQEWFVAERTRALATMYLTRRDDIVIKDARDAEVGLEYLIYIVKETEVPAVRQFGVALRGTPSPATEGQLDKVLRPTVRGLHRVGLVPYPVCLFHFTMEDNQGYYTWVAEPAVIDGAPKLLTHSEPHCRKLDREALDGIVNQVDRWYDAFFANISIRAS
jgi:hypothetical protein